MLKTEAYINSSLFLALSKKNGYKAGVLYAYKGDGFIWDRNSTAYRTNSAGVLELMGSDVPRVDYTNTCPEILIEDESINIELHSQDLDNGAITKSGGGATANTITAPDGTLTGDTFTENSSAGAHYFYPANITVTNGVEYTISRYLKMNGRRYVLIYEGYSDIGAYFDLQSGVVMGNQGAGTLVDKGIEVVNGWYRCWIKYVQSGIIASPQTYLSNNGTSFNYTGDGTSGIYVWGRQTELGVLTSYIPTTTTAVTRPQDIAYNTSVDVTGLVGTIFVRVRVFESTYAKTDTILSINDGTTDNYILIFTDENRDLTISTYGNPDQNDYTYSVFGFDGVYNIAVGYDFSGANNLINISVDGVQTQSIITQVNAPPTALNRIDLGSIVGNLPQVDNKIIGVQWFNTQLDDSSLAALTTA